MVTNTYGTVQKESPMHTERGQALLIIILIMVVILTVGMSLASRSILNVRQTTDVDNSQRAFSAAEAGIQVALESGTDVGITEFNSTTSYQAAVHSDRVHQFNLKNGSPILQNEGTDIWLSTYPAYAQRWSGDLTLFWGSSEDPCRNAALEIAVLSGTIADPTFNHFTFEPCEARRISNNFSAITASEYTNADKSYRYRVTLPTITNGIIVRVIPIYTSSIVGAATGDGNPLPPQGEIIESIGKSGGTQRKIVVVRGNPKLPLELFPYVLFTTQ